MGKTTALIIDGSYARIQGRVMGGKINFALLRTELENMTGTEFKECWYFDSVPKDARGDSRLASEYHGLKFARPGGPHFQVEIFSTKKYKCHCKSCGSRFLQNVQKGVDDAISTKLLTLTLKNDIDRVILFSGDGDFHSSLSYIRNQERKEVWVVGFHGTVSGDLQQLACSIVWVDNMWDRVKLQGGKARESIHSRLSSRPTNQHSYDRHDKYAAGSTKRRRTSSPPPYRRTSSPHRRTSSPHRRTSTPHRRASSPHRLDTQFPLPMAVLLTASPPAPHRLDTQFPLPMAVPLTATPAAVGATRTRPLFDWIFGNKANE